MMYEVKRSLIWLGILVLIGLSIGGWAINLLIVCDDSLPLNSDLYVFRVIGIFFPPLGALLGYV